MEEAAAIYRARFRPSPQLDKPHLMLALNVFAAGSDEEARFLMSSVQQMFVALRRGTPGKLPPPREGYEDELGPQDRAILEHALSCTVAGDRETVRRGLAAFVERTGADELIVTTQMFDHAARLRSFELLAEVHAELRAG
jgi:alkanesulfonate monooxygenase SsuD/methylene tetrahydromethanopterin reductase-like flavin-dependent oxidoreductase (luciferase family)